MYDRLTKRINGAVTIKNEIGSDMSFLDRNAQNALDRLAELEDKIEHGKVYITKFARNQEVFYIAYNTIAYECPHCGEECYKEEIRGVEKGIICEKVITENQDGIEVVYTLQIEYKKNLPLFTKRTEENIFLTREEAEKRLKELQNG